MPTPTARRMQPLPWAISLVAIAAALMAFTQPGGAIQPPRVAIVDVEAVMNGMTEFKALNDKQKARFEKLDAQLKATEEKLKAMAADINAMNRDDPDRPDKVIAFRKLEESTKTEVQLLRSLRALERGEMVSGLYTKASGAIEKIALRDKYDLVLQNDGKVNFPANVAEQDAITVIMQRKVLYAAPTLDITQQVVSLLNNDWNAGKR